MRLRYEEISLGIKYVLNMAKTYHFSPFFLQILDTLNLYRTSGSMCGTLIVWTLRAYKYPANCRKVTPTGAFERHI